MAIFQSYKKDNQINNTPSTELILNGGTFLVQAPYKSVAYVVIGNNGSITTAANGVTRPLFDGESGEFKCDEEKSFTNSIEFITGANTTIVLNLMQL